MGMVGRNTGAQGRYGFNGKERDKEVVQYDYGFRIYDPRLAKFKSVDPLTNSYPWYTPYQFAGNTPISAIDLDGLEERIVTMRTWTDQNGNHHTDVTNQEDVKNIYNLGTGTLYISIIDKTKYDKGEKNGQQTFTVYYESSLKDVFENLFKDNTFGFVYVSKGGQGSELKFGSKNVKFAETLDISILVGVMSSMKSYGDFGSIGDFMSSKNIKVLYDVFDKFIESGGKVIEALKVLESNNDTEEPKEPKQTEWKDTINTKKVKLGIWGGKISQEDTIIKGKNESDPDTIRTLTYE